MKHPKDFSLEDIRHIRQLADAEYAQVPADIKHALSSEDEFALRMICLVAATNSFADHGR